MNIFSILYDFKQTSEPRRVKKTTRRDSTPHEIALNLKKSISRQLFGSAIFSKKSSKN